MLFAIFSILFFGLLYTHFSLAHMVWSQAAGSNSSELDLDYVRIEDYFGRSFRRKVRDWMKLPYQSTGGGALHIIDRGVEKLIVAGRGMFPARSRERLAMVFEDNFTCAADCSFDRELMVNGDVSIGRRTHLQALASNGSARLEPGVVVRRWLDVAGNLEMAAGCKVMSRVYSSHSIFFGSGAEALSLYAPEIETEGRLETSGQNPPERREVVLIPHAANITEPVHGYDPRLLFAMGGGSYLYNGSLELSAPLHVRSPLVVKGNLKTMEGCMIDADMKIKGIARIGPMSVIRGNLVSEGDMEIGEGVFFQSILHCGRNLLLKHGVRGFGDHPVVAYAAHTLAAESDVVVRGKLSAGDKVKSVSAPIAWLKNPAAVS